MLVIAAALAAIIFVASLVELVLRPAGPVSIEKYRNKTFVTGTPKGRFAAYVDNWSANIERIGNLNYPEEARRNRIHGSVQLTVGIKSDGALESVEIKTSSGSTVLDQAAIDIVRLAAPFDRFPGNLGADTDILYITRTLTFNRGEQANR